MGKRETPLTFAGGDAPLTRYVTTRASVEANCSSCESGSAGGAPGLCSTPSRSALPRHADQPVRSMTLGATSTASAVSTTTRSSASRTVTRQNPSE